MQKLTVKMTTGVFGYETIPVRANLSSRAECEAIIRKDKSDSKRFCWSDKFGYRWLIVDARNRVVAAY